MIWFWISLVLFIGWFVAWMLGAADAVLWGLTMAWMVTLNIGAMVHKYPPRPVQQARKG